MAHYNMAGISIPCSYHRDMHKCRRV